MHEQAYPALLIVGCHLLLGGLVFAANPRRGVNRSFLLAAILIAIWVGGIELVFVSTSEAEAAFWIKFCSAVGALVIPAFVLLRASVLYQDESWRRQFRHVGAWWGIGFFFFLFCLSPFYVREVNLVALPGSGGHLVPRPVYAPTKWLHFLYLAAAMLAITVQMVRDQFQPKIRGVHKVELQFIWLAWLTVPTTVALSALLQVALHGFQLTRYAAPVRVIIFDLIIAYGITSRGILQIRSFLRRGLSYLLLTTYAGLIYTAAWLSLRWACLYAGNDSSFWPSVLAGGLATLLVSFLGTPFRKISQRILPSDDMDFEKIFARVRPLLQSVATLRELLRDFNGTLGQAVGARSVRVLVPNVGGFCELDGNKAPFAFDEPSQHGLCLCEDELVVQALRRGAPDIAVEELSRRASTAEERALLGRLKAMEADLIVPARYRGELSAIILLSQRVGGRIYGVDGRSTLRLVAEQLGIAIVNAHLYTEVYRSQAYNRLLVEHLPCGVVTTDPEGTVRVLNPEACRLLQVDESVAPGDVELPTSFTELVGPTLRNQAESPPEEIVLRAGSRDQANLRVNCLPLEGEHGELLGAVLVLNDHTALERLQRAVRQADRLASIGTLASGMAHEIKNPLTALKTFTQLLPKRYNDAEFRHDFSGLAGSEIARIERIVNQLLAFARPAPLMIEQVNLHEIATNAVKLVGPQASRHQVTVRTALKADPDYIAADKDRLQQVLLNLLLNAIQANADGGWIEVASETEPVTEEHEAFIRLDVRDGGSGIPQDILPHIFDPFFTTKGEGTGLGLSVSYNIVAEHKGRLEVQSEAGKGTCFSLYLPVC